ncbi:MAG: MarR family transcriptional regulator [Bacteroidetes bacterium]|nr:MarR family transcriptional regulator [Bacteroidota bacterium]
MLLEDEIQQSSFKTPQQKLAINLLYTTNWLSNHYDKFFKGLDLTTQQYNVLRILRGQHPNPCSLKCIKERMLDKMSDTSRILDKLVVKGYAVRNECPNDRRSVNILISDAGLSLLKELDFIDDATKDIFKSLTTQQIETLNGLLDDLRGK